MSKIPFSPRGWYRERLAFWQGDAARWASLTGDKRTADVEALQASAEDMVRRITATLERLEQQEAAHGRGISHLV